MTCTIDKNMTQEIGLRWSRQPFRKTKRIAHKRMLQDDIYGFYRDRQLSPSCILKQECGLPIQGGQ
jgi:hypothetical protein